MNKISARADQRKAAREHDKRLRMKRVRVWFVVYAVLSKLPPDELGEQMYGNATWRAIFLQVFEREPSGNADPDWDVLFTRSGYRALSAASQWYWQRRRKK